MRTGLPVEVGVSIGGTAARPIVRLYSDPSMPRSLKSSIGWCSAGHRVQQATADRSARFCRLRQARCLRARETARLDVMRSFGIDEISLRPGQDSSSILPREVVAGTLRSATGTNATGDFVAVGKRLNDDLYLTFEQAISGTATYVALNYQISRRLSLIWRAGTTTALDLVYSIAFD